MVGHGGNIYAASRELGIPADKIADFSASINPLGTPRSVIAALQRDLKDLRHYPDPAAVELTAVIAKSTGLPRESIVCGNGSTELIYLIARALRPKRVLIPAPTFSEYENAIKISQKPEVGSQKLMTRPKTKRRRSGDEITISYLQLSERDGFRINADDFIAAMKERIDMAFICNPNNPTGGLVSKADMSRIAEAAREAGCYLVVDESFIDFIPRESVVKRVKANPYLIVLRSLTKFYALSGLRIGYGVFDPQLIDTIRKCKEPWTINTLAQIAGVTALNDSAYKHETFRVIKEEKEYLEKGFRRIGIHYHPSRANFYLLRVGNAPDIVSRLRASGILVRDCSDFRGLDGSYVRVAVRSRRENMRLLKGLAKS